jgi:putative ABC transport system permease protein
MQQIKKIDGVTSVSRKSIIPVSIWMGDESHDSVVKAIDFSNTFYFGPDQITQMEGTLPSKASTETLITTKLANAQHLKRGDTFTFLSKTATGGSNALSITITGIVTFKDNDLNTNSFYISPDTLSSMLRENDGSLALMIYTNGEVSTQTVTTTLNDDTLLVRSWHEMNAIQDILDYSSRMYTYMEIIFFLLASTVIINTTMMSVIERKREAATLMALGFESSWVRNLFLLESTLISVVASLTGTLIGAILVNTLGRKGISLDVFGGDAISGYGLNTVLYFTLPIKDYMTTILYAVGIAMIACIFPTRKILKIQIATALHDEI